MLSEKVKQFAPARLTADVSKLPERERQVLGKLIEASRLLDPVFDRQAHAANPELRERLASDSTPEGRDKLAYFDIMRGPWDRQDHHRPFATDRPRPPGAGFYPEDLSADELHAWTAQHPGDKEAFESLFTLIRRDAGRLVAVPYSRAYAAWLGPAGALLEEAAALTANESLRRFLGSRAEAFRSDDYHASDKDWMDLDSPVEVTIGPYETYEDELLGLKASFESFVTVSDPEASRRLAKYKELLPEMERNLPIPDEVKTERGGESPIQVVDLVYSAGDARKSVQTIAFNLPNDERVRAEKGAKKVLLRNVIETKFELIMRPIAERILDPAQLEHLSADAFFNETLFHELSHSLGPAFTNVGGAQVEVRLALGSTYSALEEAKADVMGAHNVLFMIERGHFPADFREKLLVSYFAGLFRSTRFGVAEAHGKGAALQINRFLEERAARFDPVTRRFTVDPAGLEAAIARLVRDLCMVQHRGDRQAGSELLSRYGAVSGPMQQALGGLEGIPIDIRPIYPLAGE
ncbi:dipeptidyl-peptidase 3 family protein [Sorangium sp. So ce1389]|uniref:dipeptidyl-peptidase 3 family protein n=1 Tax=Sorangium sp. So ce1389 TaxID=3133336 RepID=UPI003F5E955F